mgnify:FL=1
MGFRKYIKCNVLKERTGGNIKMSERNYMEVYEQWVNNPLFGQETKDELLSIKDDPKEI